MGLTIGTWIDLPSQFPKRNRLINGIIAGGKAFVAAMEAAAAGWPLGEAAKKSPELSSDLYK